MTKQVRHRKSSSTDSRQSQDGASGSLRSKKTGTPADDYGFRVNGRNDKKEEFNLKPII